jgi:hypothetical protein
MTANPIWVAGYGTAPIAGATPVWVAPHDANNPTAVESKIVGWGGNPVAGATPVNIVAYGPVAPPAGLGASPIWLSSGVAGGGGGGSPVSYVLLLTSGPTWTVPSDWNNANNSIEAIGGGGGGGAGSTTTDAAGGGGGEYRKAANVTLTPGAVIPIQIGQGGTGGTTPSNATAGTATTFNTSTVIANGGGRGNVLTGGLGGTGGTGAAANSNGGASSNNSNASYGGCGGGGAGGPLGVGGLGADGGAAPPGAGGGGAQNGATGAGVSGSGGNGGNGGPSPTHAGGVGGVNGVSSPGAGVQGSGGGGGSVNDGAHMVGAAGGAGVDWIATTGGATAGPGGGGGGGGGRFTNAGAGGAGGLYGGGGGAGGAADSGAGGAGANGANGIIVIKYTTAGGSSHSAQALAYLARTVGGNEGGNGENIATLIDGLVADGVWNNLDALYIMAQQNATDARLNLVSTSYTLPSTGATFTAYKGLSLFTSGLDTGFNPTSSPGAKFAGANGSMGVWCYDAPDNGFSQMGTGNGIGGSAIAAYYGAGTQYYGFIAYSSAPIYTTPTDAAGFYSADKPTSAGTNNYLNGVFTFNDPSGTATLDGNDMFVGAGGSLAPTQKTLSAACCGSSLGAAGHLAVYNRLRTYMTAIGVP